MLLLLGISIFLAGAGSVAGAGPGQVTDLRPFRSGGSLCVEIRARDLLDERTRLTVESGLPGTCLYLLRVEDRGGRAVLERFVERTLRFDLWENRFLLEDERGARALPSRAAADSAFSHLADCALGPLTRLHAGQEYRVVVQIAVRPLAPEDRRRLSGYISRTSGGGGEEVALDLSVVFRGILGGKARSKPSAQHAGPFFRVDELPEGP